MNTPSSRPSVAALFFSFLRLGLTAFGGPAMVAYIRKMAVEQKGWLDAGEFENGVALCQVIPGATAMQLTAYIGLKLRGVPGAAVSFIGFGLPAFLLMLGLAALYTATRELPTVTSAFSGLQVIIVAVIANAALSFGRTTLKKWTQVLIAILSAVSFYLGVYPLLIIGAAVCAGMLLIKPVDTSGETPLAPIPSTLKPILAILIVYGLGLLAMFIFRKDLFCLSFLMIRIDLSAFGGGFASVPLMYHEIVDVHGWLDNQTLMDGIALGQVTPGPIVITATFVGYLLGGLPGSVIATISIFLPSFLVVTGITPYFDRLRGSVFFQKAIGGVLCAFVGLLASVTVKFALNIDWDLAHVLLSTAALAVLLLKVDILWIILVGSILSIFLF